MPFEKVTRGIFKYLNQEVFPKMNDWQEIIARIAVGRMLNNERVKDSLVNNAFIQSFGIISNGNVDVDGLIRDLHDQVNIKGKIKISIPMIGDYSFTAEDINVLHRCILEG